MRYLRFQQTARLLGTATRTHSRRVFLTVRIIESVKGHLGISPSSSSQANKTPTSSVWSIPRSTSHHASPRFLPTTRAFHTSVADQAIKPFLLADIGEGITECEVIQWFVEPGATVAEFDKICEVQSDKASVEITSRFAGRIVKLHHQVNDIAKVGEPLVDVETDEEIDDGGVSAPKAQELVTEKPASPAAAASETVKDKSISSRAGSSGTLATPAVRGLAKEHNVDISQITGSGDNGRVLKDDVLNFISGKQGQPQASAESVLNVAGANDRVETLNGIQKAMFKSMTKSLSIPQLGYKDEIELNATTDYRAALNRHVASHPQMYPFTKMTYLPIFIKCLSIALSHYPIMNATLTGSIEDINNMKVTYRASHNVGVAMDTPQGLIVPNVKDVQSKTIFEIASEIHRLTELAKKGSLSTEDLRGGTISLSNIGSIGGLYANPVVVSSELAIVALGRIQKLPRFDASGNIVAKQILPVSWSADHRVIDGATIARFGNHWKNLIENPALLASELR
ncbi:2-oxoacid dehydrogenases acyltransferase-domain-containing protein [Radiomyces spectabilis]|uniref:2-oxoacid dehydrogenases acyltransferase-domain-containing protein n=1 Tax=Radiomyces spectabilis TaxID=64574 RepID=UPI002220110C|nr:2-oxoacid dehydrogenases acyltransferase-domain-containing protein [Radiomyces spectabilis]KAI8394138.1 2-oxoacid dehydrogenases acyltransferase-domain-containing protein [Radiomyces spectabilis]